MRRLLNYSGIIVALYFVFYSFIIPVHGSQKVYNSSITDQPWQEVVISVRDLEGIAAFFTEIGKYEYSLHDVWVLYALDGQDIHIHSLQDLKRLYTD